MTWKVMVLTNSKRVAGRRNWVSASGWTDERSARAIFEQKKAQGSSVQLVELKIHEEHRVL